MSELTVQEVAKRHNMTSATLLQRIAEADMPHKALDAILTEDQIKALGLPAAETQEQPLRRKITLQRRTRETLKPSRGGRGVIIEKRKRRTYVRREATPPDAVAKQASETAGQDAPPAPVGQLDAETDRIRQEENQRREAAEVAQLQEQRRREAEAERQRKETEKIEAEAAAKAKQDAEKKVKREREAEIQKQAAEATAKAQAAVQAAGRPARRKEGRDDRQRSRGGSYETDRRTNRRSISMREGARRTRRRPQQTETHGGEFRPSTTAITREVELGSAITVGELAKQMSIKTGELIRSLMDLGVMATINDVLDQDTAVLVVEELGHRVKLISEDRMEEEHLAFLEVDGDREPRCPVVTVMGHVDHGKTSLLDYIRKSRVVAGEAGGITQHIGAYNVSTSHGDITFLDTPGHAAFSAMRARGANATDIVILVCAADDGVMPQTQEAVQHAKAAEVPIVVAVNKMDLPGANPDKVRTELNAIGVVPDDWGGDTQFVHVSAETGDGVEELLGAVSLQAELMELSAVPNAPGRGVVVESRVDRGRGPVATLLVQNGTLSKGEVVIAGEYYGKVRALLNEFGSEVKEAGPSIAVEMLGLNGTPSAGDDFSIATDDRQARQLADSRAHKIAEVRHAVQQSARFDNMFASLGKNEKRVMKLVLKADVRGSLEAITQACNDIGNEEVSVNILGSGVGGISESDANMAVTYEAVIFGFNVRMDNAAKVIAEREGIEVRYYNVIYELLDDVTATLRDMLVPEIREEIVGSAEVREVFGSPRFGQIAGCMVVDGSVFRNKKIRVLRDNTVIYEGELESLRRFKDDVLEVRNGLECGIGVRNYNDVRSGDLIEVYESREVARSL